MIRTFLSAIGFLIIVQSFGQDTIRKYHNTDSTILSAEFVVNNETQIPDGMFKVYFEDGTLREHRIFKNGHLWDIILLKATDGEKIKDVGTLTNGNGTVKIYDAKNNLQAMRTLMNGILNGESIKYYDNGHIAMKGNYLDGHRCGTWFRYDELGKLKENGERDFGSECK